MRRRLPLPGMMIISCLFFLFFSFTPGPKEQLRNILLLIVDDQNDNIGPFSDGHFHTPNLERLARSGTLFTQAYCSAPACGPSRASFLLGQLPSTTGIYYNSQPNANTTNSLSNAISLPGYFKENGYLTGIYGKVFHEKDNFQHAELCSPGYFAPHLGFWANVPDSSIVCLTDFRSEGGSNFAWGSVPDQWENKDHKLIDTDNADKVIEVISQSHDQPFFIALGLLRPHLPWIVPQRFFEMYPLEEIELPEGFIEGDLDDLPECAKWMAKEVPGSDIGNRNCHEAITSAGKWREAMQAYYASTAYMDHQLGRVLDALERSPNAENTIIILCCDHGYHLGEKEHWTKFGLWEKTNRVPLIITSPGSISKVCNSPVSLLDIYPTLISLSGIKKPVEQELEGFDLSSIVSGQTALRGRPVLSTYGYQNHSLRNDRYRYIRYRNGEEEFYDHLRDPYEWNNLANDPDYTAEKEALARYLPAVNVAESDDGSGLGWDPEVFNKTYIYEGL